MRRLIHDSDLSQQPLKILQQKIPVLEKTQHAQIHANARNQPTTSCMLIFGLGHLAAQPEIHGRRPKQKRSERRVPGAVKNVAGYDENIFAGLPGANAPVNGNDDYEKNDESE